MLKVVVLSVVLVALAVVLLGVRVFFVRNRRFPSAHAHSSEQLRNRGVGCHRDL